MHAVVGEEKFLPEHSDLQGAIANHAHELHDEVVTHRPMPDDDDLAPLQLHWGEVFCRRRWGTGGRRDLLHHLRNRHCILQAFGRPGRGRGKLFDLGLQSLDLILVLLHLRAVCALWLRPHGTQAPLGLGVLRDPLLLVDGRPKLSGIFPGPLEDHLWATWVVWQELGEVIDLVMQDHPCRVLSVVLLDLAQGDPSRGGRPSHLRLTHPEDGGKWGVQSTLL
mmetsp:Transcript_38313/g.84056  ORF Transcript_38313/g.84056 Transcript_38313/m.84056 type:complete len:222 (+) Transcript_38313:1946-2611(+)